MSNTITTAFVRQFNSNVTFLYQQRGSKLRGRFQEKRLAARYTYFDRVAPTAAVKKTVRHGDTPLVNTQHSRRRAEVVDYEWADMVDKQDDFRILIQPTSSYARNASMAMGRSYDEEGILAFDADAREGEEGNTVTTWASFVASNADHQIAAGGTGMTVLKLQNAKLALDNQNVDDDGRLVVVSPEGIIDLLSDPEVTSADYNTVRALVAGTVNGPFMGFDYVRTTLLDVASNIRQCWAFHQMAMGMLVGMEFTVRISERDDKSYSTQVYVSGSFGGVRVLDEGLVEINIDESV